MIRIHLDIVLLFMYIKLYKGFFFGSGRLNQCEIAGTALISLSKPNKVRSEWYMERSGDFCQGALLCY